MKNIVIFCLLLFFASSTPAVVVISEAECPDKFVGKIASIIPPAIDSPFAVNKVIFTNLETKKQVFVDILKNGFQDLEVGETYNISMRKGALCLIEHIQG